MKADYKAVFSCMSLSKHDGHLLLSPWTFVYCILCASICKHYMQCAVITWFIFTVKVKLSCIHMHDSWIIWVSSTHPSVTLTSISLPIFLISDSCSFTSKCLFFPCNSLSSGGRSEQEWGHSDEECHYHQTRYFFWYLYCSLWSLNTLCSICHLRECVFVNLLSIMYLFANSLNASTCKRRGKKEKRKGLWQPIKPSNT